MQITIKWREKTRKNPRAAWRGTAPGTQRARDITWVGNFTAKLWQLYRVRERKIHSAIVVSHGVPFIHDGEASRQNRPGQRWCLWSQSSGETICVGEKLRPAKIKSRFLNLDRRQCLQREKCKLDSGGLSGLKSWFLKRSQQSQPRQNRWAPGACPAAVPAAVGLMRKRTQDFLRINTERKMSYQPLISTPTITDK